MSIEYEDECVGRCPGGCVEYCKYKNVPHYYCDCCGEEHSLLYNVDGEMICLGCIKENFSFKELVEMIYERVRE